MFVMLCQTCNEPMNDGMRDDCEWFEKGGHR